MKKILLFLATFVMAFALNAQNSYLSEDFENAELYSTDIAGWINYDTAAAHANPWKVKAYDNNQFAQASAYNTNTVVSAFLISPAIDLSNAASNINLYFEVKVAYWKHDGLKVMVSTDFTPGTDTLDAIRSATWTDLNVTFPQEPTSGYGEFNNYSVDLSNYQGQTIYIAFVYQGDADNNQTTTYQVDNVVVEGEASAAVNDVPAVNFSVYPNPVADVLSISADESINRIEVFNAVGQQVKGVNVNSSRATLDVSDLNSGVYFLRVYSKDGVSAVKVLKR